MEIVDIQARIKNKMMICLGNITSTTNSVADLNYSQAVNHLADALVKLSQIEKEQNHE